MAQYGSGKIPSEEKSVMSTETKKPRKAPVKKDAAATAEKKAKAARRSKTAKAATVEVTVVASNIKQWPSHTEIAVLAHRYYEERGHKHGFHEEDWLRAELELQAAS
jgi:hypothetical protein